MKQIQLFYKSDVLQMRDKSQWEIYAVHFENAEFLYELINVQNDEHLIDTEKELNKKAIVIKFATDIEPRQKCKIYYIDDYRNKMQKTG